MTYTKKEFELLRKKYGPYGSWAVWDECDKTHCNHCVDQIGCNSCMLKHLDKLHANFVFLGLNISKPIVNDWNNFRTWKNGHLDRSSRFTSKLAQIGSIDKLKGSYLTDIIKEHEEPDSGSVLKDIKTGSINIEKNISLLINELHDIGFDAQKGKVIILGISSTKKVFEKYFIERLKISNIIYIRHYSDFRLNNSEWFNELKILLKVS